MIAVISTDHCSFADWQRRDCTDGFILTSRAIPSTPPSSGTTEAQAAAFAHGMASIAVTADRVTIQADHMSRTRMHWSTRALPETVALVVTDDPFVFAGHLPPARAQLSLLPILKFIPAPMSAVENVATLAAGERIEFARADFRPLRSSSALAALATPAPARETASVAIPALIARAVTDTLAEGTADVFLSGGLDSAMIALELKRAGAEVHAWTATYGSQLGRTEEMRAKATAHFLGIPHTVITIDSSTGSGVDGVLRAMTDPFADVATVAEAGLAEHAATMGVQRVFEGEGVDSLWCGSYKFVAERYRPFLAPLLSLVPTRTLVGRNRNTAVGALKLKMSQLQALLSGNASVFDRHFRFLVSSEAHAVLGSPDLSDARDAFRRLFDCFPALDELTRLCAMTFWGNIPTLENRKLAVVERITGIEIVTPFQDIRLVHAALHVPPSEKVHRGYGKHLLRRAYRDALPAHTLTRKKLSFVPPVVESLNAHQRDAIQAGTLVPRHIGETWLREHREGKADRLSELWATLVAHDWIERYANTRLPLLEQHATAIRAG